MNENDHVLISRFLNQGDEDAFCDLVRRHERKIRAVAISVLGDSPDVDDVLQETLVLLLRKGRQLTRPERMSAWLHGVAWRLAIKTARRRRPNTSAEKLSPSAGIGREAEDLEMGQIVRASLEQLPEKHRHAIELAYYHDQTHDEIARKLQLPRGSIARVLQQGLILLRSELRARSVSASVLAMVWISATDVSPLVASEISDVARRAKDRSESMPPSDSLDLVQYNSSLTAQSQITSVPQQTKWALAVACLLATGIFVSHVVPANRNASAAQIAVEYEVKSGTNPEDRIGDVGASHLAVVASRPSSRFFRTKILSSENDAPDSSLIESGCACN